jgi:diguanylate cyclase (GGDEF)-like protein
VLRALKRAEGPDRRAWQGFLAMTLVPWVSNVAYLGFGLRFFGTDPTPLSFAVAVAGMAWLIGRNALFKVVPLARRLLFTELPDPVLILDASGRVMEANAAALALVRETPPRGTPLALWPRLGARVAERLATGSRATALVTLNDPPAIYEMRVRTIGEAPRQIGRLVQLRDVTEQQRMQARIVQTLAERNAQLSRVASLQHELRDQAQRDPLTGLHNRRALVERFAEELAHHRATAQPLALAVLDIDHFKRINDSHGHAAGDRVLCSLAREMCDALRASDTVYRTGGEEFALLLPGADAGNALRRVDALRERVAAAELGVGGQPVTFSAGVAAVGPGLETLDALLQAADRALYAAKASGRNRCLVDTATAVSN